MAISGNENTIALFSTLYQRVYQGADEDLYNFKHELLKRLQITDGFVGTDEMRMRVTGHIGGYGAASSNSNLPFTTVTPAINPLLTAKKFYATHQLDGEAIAAAMRGGAAGKGAFADLVKHSKEMMNRAIENGLSLMAILGDINNDVILGVVRPSGDSPVSGSGPWTVKLVVSSFNKNRFHINQVVEFGSSTDPFLITAISADATTPTITVARQSGSATPAADDEIFLQGCNGNAMIGLKAITASSGTLFNVSISTTNNFKSVIDSAGGSVNENRLFNMCLDIQDQSGEMPDTIVCSLAQYKKIMAFISNSRIREDGNDHLGHGDIKLVLPGTNVEIIWDRQIDKDKIYFLNMKRIQLRKRPNCGLVEGPNGVLHPMHVTGADKYLIVYACYGNIYTEPTYHGVMSGLDE